MCIAQVACPSATVGEGIPVQVNCWSDLVGHMLQPSLLQVCIAGSHSTCWIPRSFSAELTSSWVAPSTSWCLGFFLTRCRSFLFFFFFFFELHEDPVSSFLQSSSRGSSGWQHNISGITATPPIFVSSVKLLRVHFTPPSRSFMLSSAATSMDSQVHH